MKKKVQFVKNRQMWFGSLSKCIEIWKMLFYSRVYILWRNAFAFMEEYCLKPSWRVWSKIVVFSLSLCGIFEFCPRNSLCCIDLLIQETELICMCKLAPRTFPFTGLYGWWTVYLISFFRALSLSFRAKDVISALVTWRTYLCELNYVMSPKGFQAGCF